MRDPESIAIAVTAAETGHLVLSTLHTGNGPQTIRRIIDAYPSGQSEVVRTQLAATLEAVVSQQLVPRVDHNGRVPVVELLRATDAVRNLIRKNQIEQVGTQISLGKAGGMLSFDASLAQLVQSGLVDVEDARRRARHAKEFDLLLD
jgi:twitching motility protein PilT